MSSPTNGSLGAPPAEVEGGWVDWDVQIEIPPPRPERIVTVQFVASGRCPLVLPDDPRD